MTRLAASIHSQVEVLSAVMEIDLDPALERLRGAERVWLVGTGTSRHAAELGTAMLRSAGADARWSSSAGFARLRPPPDPKDAVVLITHTGETAFARSVRLRAIDRGSPLVSITAVGVGWPEAIGVAPRESSETYTASYTAALVALARIAGALGAAELSESAIGAAIGAVSEALRDPGVDRVSRPARLLAIAGSGPGAITAREGALKLREAARVPAEGFEAEHLLHGSAVPLGSRDVLLLLQPRSDPDGLLAALGSAARAEGITTHELRVDAALDPLLVQIPLTVALQRLAAGFADEAGLDPDSVIAGAWADEALWAIGGP